LGVINIVYPIVVCSVYQLANFIEFSTETQRFGDFCHILQAWHINRTTLDH
jgi:hypothetical protein